MKLLDDQLIEQTARGDMRALAKLDRHGLFPAPDENAALLILTTLSGMVIDVSREQSLKVADAIIIVSSCIV